MIVIVQQNSYNLLDSRETHDALPHSHERPPLDCCWNCTTFRYSSCIFSFQVLITLYN